MASLTFHTSQDDATTGANALVNSTVVPAVNTTYYVRGALTSTCFATASMTVTVVNNPNPIVANGQVCAGGSIDLNTLVTNAGGGTLSFHTTLADAQTGTNPLGSATVSPASATNYYVRSAVTFNGVTCYGVKEITVSMKAANCGTITVTGPN